MTTIESLLEQLPDSIRPKIFKYLSHPAADAIRPWVDEFNRRRPETILPLDVLEFILGGYFHTFYLFYFGRHRLNSGSHSADLPARRLIPHLSVFPSLFQSYIDDLNLRYPEPEPESEEEPE